MLVAGLMAGSGEALTFAVAPHEGQDAVAHLIPHQQGVPGSQAIEDVIGRHQKL